MSDTSWFWCEKHNTAHRKGEDTASCLLVGPFPTKEEAEGFDSAVRQAVAATDELHDRRRVALEQALVSAALKLLRHTGAHSFQIPIPDTTPKLFVCVMREAKAVIASAGTAPRTGRVD